MQVRFRMDNTEGYHRVQLDMLNASFNYWMGQLGDPTEKSAQDRLAERVLEEYGDEALLRTLTEMPTEAEYRSRMIG
jgi:hypothetical protein